MKISDQLNDLIKDQSHLDILLMHLMKKHHGPQGVLNLLVDKHKKCWEPFNCLTSIKENLKVYIMYVCTSSYVCYSLSYTVQLTNKFTLMCRTHACVLQFNSSGPVKARM